MYLLQRLQPRPKRRLQDVTYASAPHVETLFFICGLHRSGTTLIERYVAGAFDIAYLRATVPESEGQHLQSVYPPALKFGGPGRFAFSADMQRATDKITDYENARRSIIADWSRFVVGDHPALIEKSPPNLTKIPWLRKVFPESKFLIVTRDPRAVAAATRKWSWTSLSTLVEHWAAAYSMALDAYDDTDCLIVRYEDFCDDPERELNRIGRFADLKRREGQIEERFSKLKNSNPRYIEKHRGREYGRGVWNEFGYDI